MHLRETLRSCSAALYLLLTTTALDASAAQGPLGRALVRELPGLGDVRAAHVKQLSRDGSKALVWIPGDPGLVPAHVRVLDTRTGALIFDSRPEQTATRGFADALLTGDGQTLIFGEIDSAGSVRTVRARGLASSTERVLFTGHSTLLLSTVSDDGQVVAYTDGHVSAPIVLVRAAGAPQRFGMACPAGATPARASGPVSLSGDGRYLTYLSVLQVSPLPRVPVAVDAETGGATCLTNPNKGTYDPWPGVAVSHDGRWILVPSEYPTFSSFTSVLTERATGRTMPLLPTFERTRVADISDDSRHVIFKGAPLAGTVDGLYLLDRDLGIVTEIEAPSRDRLIGPLAIVSGDGNTAAYDVTPDGLASTGRVVPHVASLNADSDVDGLTDAWEATFGLDPLDPGDAAQDQDGDGATAAQELAAGSHPRAPAVRHFAEGADGTFFSTSLALFNPSDATVLANVRFLGPDGARAATPVQLPARSPAYLDAGSLGMTFTEFSIVVESPVPLAVERRMMWDRTRVYGSHSSTGAASPALTWYFAEGATIGGIQTFFLLQNPGTTAAHVTVHYWLSNGASETRVHVVPAESRLTVWANQEGAPLDAAEFATTIEADVPVVAERAVYRDAPGQTFGAGSVASGVTAPDIAWSFAEGATGAYFDTFLLLANPGDVAATAQVYFHRADARLEDTDLWRTYVIAPRSRRTVWVDLEDARLADAAFLTSVVSNVPIVAERAMWWPGPTSATWHGSHVETGARTGTLWAVADVEVGSTTDVDTFICVGSRGVHGTSLRITLHYEDGTSSTRIIGVYGRYTLWPRYAFPESVGRRFAVTIESLSTLVSLSTFGRIPIVVERATYRWQFEAGAASLGTRLPDPP